MNDLQSILTAIDQLEPADLLKLWQYVEQKTQALLDSPEQLAPVDELLSIVQEDTVLMTDDEIDSAVEEVALDVERGRQSKSG